MTAARPEGARPPLGEALELLRLVWEVDHALQSASKRMEAALGVTGPQRLMLRIVGRFPRIPAGQTRDPQDGRRVLLGLTDQGRILDGERAGTIEGAVRRALARLSAEDVRGARATMSALAAALEATAEDLTHLAG
jgi:hypothetical protein